MGRCKKCGNDEQDTAIYNAISSEHNKLCVFYEELKFLENEHKGQKAELMETIKRQEDKVIKLAEGRIKTYVDKDMKLILDLTD